MVRKCVWIRCSFVYVEDDQPTANPVDPHSRFWTTVATTTASRQNDDRLHGTEEVRSSILLSSTMKPQVHALGLFAFRIRVLPDTFADTFPTTQRFLCS